ncbi:MAG TPA: aminotransferase class III-fold pyridoxal phosphate-dependent enzyme, partial [Kiloniellales bacterium]|nr:aminotransferase class III-fold pyridoxal phosphate-dependent enzyme [Kiloniellales bacterium]
MSADGSRSSNSALKSRVDEVERAYVAANPKSKTRFEAATGPMPGGNTRTVLHFSPFPLGFAKGEGCFVEDLDGHRYTDFLGEYSAGLYGHSEPVIVEAIRKALADGIVLGGPNRYEAELAGELCQRFPSIDQVRFTNSGTEANLLALAAARIATGRQAVMVMEGGYHGGVLYFGQHKSQLNVSGPWVYGHYNDLEQTRTTIEREARDLAAILVEPMMGSGGGICATPEYLAMLRQQADRHGIVLIYDEVMTSRMSYGGLQER